MSFNVKQNFFVCWTNNIHNDALDQNKNKAPQKATYFYDFQTSASPWQNIEPVCHFNDLGLSPDDFITDIVLIDKLKYFAVATNHGSIIIHKWDPKPPKSAAIIGNDATVNQAYPELPEEIN